MVNVNISLPEDLHKGIKINCAIEDTTLKDYIIQTVSKEISKKFKS
jgi:hypothetical protein